jgi:hypothetical protein
VLRFDQHLMKTQRGSARTTIVIAFWGLDRATGTSEAAIDDGRRRKTTPGRHVAPSK